MKLEFEGEKIRIRKLKLSDADDVFRNINNKAVVRWMSVTVPYPYLQKDAIKFIRKSQRGINSKKYYNFGIVLKRTGKVIGGIGLEKIDLKNKRAEIGFWIAQKHWGKGLVKEAIEIVSKFGFKQLGFHKIYSVVFEENIASQKVLEKFGFKVEGKLVEEFYRYEKWQNIILYGLLNKN
jgi:RimJ/RimL family protein N-acetyltransferase